MRGEESGAASSSASWFSPPETYKQIAAKQPPLVVTLLFFAIIQYAGVLCRPLLWVPWFHDLTIRYPVFYQVVFFAPQMALILAAALFLSIRYVNALWKPAPSFTCIRSGMSGLAIFFPLAAWHGYKSVAGMNLIEETIRSLPPNARHEFVARVFEMVWRPLPYGISLEGVVMTSVAAFCSPVLEEIIFSGLITNALARVTKPAFAIAGTGVCFAIAHLPQYGVGVQSLELLWAGLTYAAVRFCSGSVFNSICCHLAINVVIFMPKWVIAVLRFSLP